MMKMKKVWHEEYTEYSVTITRPNGERLECYNGTVYRKKSEAQKYADRLNEDPKRVAKCGAATIDEKQIPAGWTLQGTLSFR